MSGRIGIKLVSSAIAGMTMSFGSVAEAKPHAGTAARQAAQVYTCHFPKAGTVVIDTRPATTSITARGKRHPAQSGSYFYQDVDGEIMVTFGPGASFKFWEFDGERDYHCTRS